MGHGSTHRCSKNWAAKNLARASRMLNGRDISPLSLNGRVTSHYDYRKTCRGS